MNEFILQLDIINEQVLVNFTRLKRNSRIGPISQFTIIHVYVSLFRVRLLWACRVQDNHMISFHE